MTLKVSETPTVEATDAMMGQSMYNRFEKESIHPQLNKFSSSVGFRDVPPKSNARSVFSDSKRAPGMRGSSYSRHSKRSNYRPNSNIDDYYKTNDVVVTCQNIIKILFMNCDELNRKFLNNNEEIEIVNDLLTENEEHFIDIVENTEKFLQDLQDTGLDQVEALPDSRRKIPSSANSNARKYIREIDDIIDQYAQSSAQNNMVDSSEPYRTFSSAKSNRRGEELRNEFRDTKESALFSRINNLQKEIYEKEEITSQKYERVVDRLEKNLKMEAQLHNEARRNYKVLAQVALNFQSALKDLQKAVRSKKYNIASYKKIFDERSKQLSGELQKFKSLQKGIETLSHRKRDPSYITPESSSKKTRPKSAVRIAPKNLQSTFYLEESSKKSEMIEKLENQIQKIEKQLENNLIKTKEITKERDILQELCTEKDAMIKSSLNKLKESNQNDSVDEGDRGAMQIYKNRILAADKEIEELGKEVSRLQAKEKDLNLQKSKERDRFEKELKEAKTEAEELVDDTQKLLDSKLRNLSSRLAEKERVLEKVVSEVNEKIHALETHTKTQLSNDHKATLRELEQKYKTEITQLKNRIKEQEELEDKLEDLKNNESEIDSLKESLKKKSSEIKKLRDDITTLNEELDEERSKYSKRISEIHQLKQDLITKDREVTTKTNEISQLQDSLSTLSTNLTECQSEVESLKNQIKEKNNEIRLLSSHNSKIKEDLETANWSLQQANDSLSDKEKQISELKSDLKKKIQEVRDKDQEITDISTQLKEHSQGLHGADQQLDELKSQVRELNKELKVKTTQYEQLENKYEELSAETISVRSQLESCKSDLKSKVEELRVNQNSFNELEESLNQKLVEIEQKEKQVQQYKNELDKKIQELNTKNVRHLLRNALVTSYEYLALVLDWIVNMKYN